MFRPDPLLEHRFRRELTPELEQFGASPLLPTEDRALASLVKDELEVLALPATAKAAEEEEAPAVRFLRPEVAVAAKRPAWPFDRATTLCFAAGGGLILGLTVLAAWLATHPRVVLVPASAPAVPRAEPAQPPKQKASETLVAASTEKAIEAPPLAAPAPRPSVVVPAAPAGQRPAMKRPDATRASVRAVEPSDEIFDTVFKVPQDSARAGDAVPKGRAVYIPPAPGEGAPAKESLTDDDVRQVVLGKKTELARCGQHRFPGLPGKLAMRWTVEPSGATSNVSVESAALRSTELAGCVSRVVGAMTFPRSRTPREPITFSFNF